MSADGDDLFEAIYSLTKQMIPDFRIKFKNESIFQRIIGFLLFFNHRYMTEYTSTFGNTVWFPSRQFVENKKRRAAKILAHELVHLVDRNTYVVLFEILYLLPQVFAVFSLFSLLAIWFSPLWLCCLLFLVFVAPIPSITRANLEMRGYAMNMAINVWTHGSIPDDMKDWVVGVFSGWGYYRMWPCEEDVRKWIDAVETKIRNVDVLGEENNTIFNDGEVYEEVYKIVTGIEFD